MLVEVIKSNALPHISDMIKHLEIKCGTDSLIINEKILRSRTAMLLDKPINEATGNAVAEVVNSDRDKLLKWELSCSFLWWWKHLGEYNLFVTPEKPKLLTNGVSAAPMVVQNVRATVIKNVTKYYNRLADDPTHKPYDGDTWYSIDINKDAWLLEDLKERLNSLRELSSMIQNMPDGSMIKFHGNELELVYKPL